MAKTSTILNPAKTVLRPDIEAGYSLAESITAGGIAEIRVRYPGTQVVSYFNTTAEVKSASDICCTSANAVQTVAAMEVDTVNMTPDKWLAQNVAIRCGKSASSGGMALASCMNNLPRRFCAISATGIRG